MRVSAQGFWRPKAGNAEDEYEDAFAIGEDCVAIADGATESSYARLWAQSLVEGFTHEPPLPARESLNEIVPRVQQLQQNWNDLIPWDRLPWFAEDKAREGAFSSLLLLQFLPPPDEESDPEVEALETWPWQALAIGDSCLFQIRSDSLLLAFPLARADQFNSRPLLLSSNPARNGRVWDEMAFLQGSYQPGDILLFVTDALAHWFMAEYEAGAKPWQTLCALETRAEFAGLVKRLRAERAMRNDDVTLVRVRQEDAADAPREEGKGKREKRKDDADTQVPEREPGPQGEAQASPSAELAASVPAPAEVEPPDEGAGADSAAPETPGALKAEPTAVEEKPTAESTMPGRKTLVLDGSEIQAPDYEPPRIEEKPGAESTVPGPEEAR